MADRTDLTGLLRAWSDGSAGALERLTPLVHDELRRLAHRHMRRERGGHTLQTTALVNEAYIRLVDVRGIDWQDRTHFLSVCAQIMRRVLVDAARRRASAKRAGALAGVERSRAFALAQLAAPGSARAAEGCARDDALNQLAKLVARRAQVIELRFFGGLTVEETAAVLKISPQSVLRDWKL